LCSRAGFAAGSFSIRGWLGRWRGAAMSDTSRWWLASDGRWYPPSASPGNAWPPPLHRSRPPVLSTAPAFACVNTTSERLTVWPGAQISPSRECRSAAGCPPATSRRRSTRQPEPRQFSRFIRHGQVTLEDGHVVYHPVLWIRRARYIAQEANIPAGPNPQSYWRGGTQALLDYSMHRIDEAGFMRENVSATR
jgi:hypothetical protein